MPRPSKAVRRQKVNAGIEYRKGNRKEAYAIWAKAAETRRELQAKKKKNLDCDWLAEIIRDTGSKKEKGEVRLKSGALFARIDGLLQDKVEHEGAIVVNIDATPIEKRKKGE